MTFTHLKRGLPSRTRTASALLHTAPHRTPRLLEPKKSHSCVCRVKQREKRPGERRARAAGRAAETRSRNPAARLARKGPGPAVLARKGHGGWPCLHGKSPEQPCWHRAVCTGSIRGGTLREVQCDTQFSTLILSRAGLTPARDKINVEKRVSPGPSFSDPHQPARRPYGRPPERVAGRPLQCRQQFVGSEL